MAAAAPRHWQCPRSGACGPPTPAHHRLLHQQALHEIDMRLLGGMDAWTPLHRDFHAMQGSCQEHGFVLHNIRLVIPAFKTPYSSETVQGSS